MHKHVHSVNTAQPEFNYLESFALRSPFCLCHIIFTLNEPFFGNLGIHYIIILN